jgi:hypothetical protein
VACRHDTALTQFTERGIEGCVRSY